MRKQLTTSGVARTLQESEGTVRSKARRGIYPFIETESGVRLFDADTIERIAQERAERRRAASPTSDEAA